MKWYDQAFDAVCSKLEKTSSRIKDTMPHVAVDGQYDDASHNPSWWTNGFWPGLLWMMYDATGTEDYKTCAVACEEKLDVSLHGYYNIDHDAGFLWHLSAVANYKLTGSEASKQRGMIAASHLASRFNPSGDFIRAWNFANPETGEKHTGWAIIDCMMNLPMLYWASLELDDPRFKNIAKAHADMVLREFIREDGSVHHIVCFDPESGARLRAEGGQGYSPDSAWARGTAWCLYGMALSYKYTGEKRYLEASKKVADFYLSQHTVDCLPVWDFRAAKETLYAKDSSAAACAASGLLELAGMLGDEESDRYAKAGEMILQKLYENHGNWHNDNEGLLNMGTVHYPAGKFINVPIIYGDFFFVEGVLKLKECGMSLW